MMIHVYKIQYSSNDLASKFIKWFNVSVIIQVYNAKFFLKNESKFIRYSIVNDTWWLSCDVYL